MKNNKYFMYGLSIPFTEYKEWEEGTGRSFPVGEYGDIFCFFNARESKWVIVGKKIKISCYNETAIRIPELTKEEETQIQTAVKNTLGFDGDFHYYYIIE